MPPGTITGLQVLRTKAYTQWTGRMNYTGGELVSSVFTKVRKRMMLTHPSFLQDPHGADQLGNPLGGLVYSFGLPSGDNKTLAQVISWNQSELKTKSILPSRAIVTDTTILDDSHRNWRILLEALRSFSHQPQLLREQI